MQQHRLMRSRTEVIVSGVCGGLGEYFGVDPVIVRLIFVLVTLTTGLGLLIYPALWVAMPKAPALPPVPLRDPILGEGEPWNVVQREREVVASQARSASPPRYGDAPPPQSAYNFDPLTGEPIRSDAAIGQTTQLPYDPTAPEFQQNQLSAPVSPAQPRKRAPWLAFGLIAFGALVLADQIGLNMDIVFPVVMILIGVFLLRRK